MTILDKHKQSVWQAEAKRKPSGAGWNPDYSRDLFPLFDKLYAPKPYDEKTLKARICAQTVHQCLLDTCYDIKNNVMVRNKVFQLSDHNVDDFKLWESDAFMVLASDLGKNRSFKI